MNLLEVIAPIALVVFVVVAILIGLAVTIGLVAGFVADEINRVRAVRRDNARERLDATCDAAAGRRPR